MKELFMSYGDNVMIQRLETKGDTCKGKVIHCGHQSLPTGSIILYTHSDWNQVDMTEVMLDNKPVDVVDVIWRPKVRCILKEIG